MGESIERAIAAAFPASGGYASIELAGPLERHPWGIEAPLRLRCGERDDTENVLVVPAAREDEPRCREALATYEENFRRWTTGTAMGWIRTSFHGATAI